MRPSLRLLLVALLLSAACGAPPRRPVRHAPASAATSTAAIAGYYQATLEKGPTERWLVGLTIAQDEHSAELVMLQDPAEPWAGYTTLAVERAGDAVVLRLVSRTTSAGTQAPIPGVQPGAVAFSLTIEGAPRGAPPTGGLRTTWGAFRPDGADPRGFVIAEPELLGP